GRTPAARRELRAADDVRSEDREAAATADVFVLSQGGIEVHHLVEGEVVDEQQVVPRAAAADAEAGEFTGGCKAGQAVEGEQGICATPHGAAQRFAVEVGAGSG